MTTIYLVEHTINTEDYSSITVPFKAFKDQAKALSFIDDCYGESIRIVEDLMKYWDIHMEEFEKLNEEIRKMISGGKGYKIRDSHASKRSLEILEGEREIMKSHKFHPGVITHRKEESVYDMVEIELVE